MEVSPIEHKKSSLIAAYVNGTLHPKDKAIVEGYIGENDTLKKFYERKVEERDFLCQLIPEPRLSRNSLVELKLEVNNITDQIYPKDKLNVFKKIYKALDKPLFTIRF